MKKILVIAAHPDDEILGCGATIARLNSEGARIDILILAEGLTSREIKRDRNANIKQIQNLGTVAKKAANRIGANQTHLLDLPDNRLDSLDRLDIVKIVENEIQEIQPQIIFTHFYNDVNIDHRIISDAVITACRPLPAQIVRELYFFEVPSSTEWQVASAPGIFNPNYFVSVSESNLQAKLDALKIYESEMRDFPHPRSYQAVEALARWRGATAGVNAAEAFMTGRRIE
jgi:LmbE family N-acetylglucosaminyl deacetylase